jgi:hypothetical protein
MQPDTGFLNIVRNKGDTKATFIEKKSLKKIVSPDILAASIKNLELSQVNYLLRKEIAGMASSSVGSRPSALDMSNKMIRLCL